MLIVDDFEQWRRLVRHAVEGEGLRAVGEAADGMEALQKIEDLRPDLIVLDMELPTFNGLDVARRARTISPKSKVVFLTQNASDDLAEAAFHEGASAYVVKAAMARELIPAVTAALEGKHFFSPELTTLRLRPEMAQNHL